MEKTGFNNFYQHRRYFFNKRIIANGQIFFVHFVGILSNTVPVCYSNICTRTEMFKNIFLQEVCAQSSFN